MGRYISNEVRCPFYVSEDGYRVRCEGLAKKMHTHMVFPTPQSKSAYKKRYCDTRYKDCLLCKALYSKYGGDDDE